MRNYGFVFISIFLLLNCCSKQIKEPFKLTTFVNPFIGSDGPGNTYPGATIPFGMVQLSPDIGIPGWDRIAGYYYQDSIISGFSHTHLSGTGAGDMYDILVTVSYTHLTLPTKTIVSSLSLGSLTTTKQQLRGIIRWNC